MHSEFRLWQSICGGMSNWAFSKRQRACCRRGGQARSAPYTANYQPDMLRYCAEARTLRGDRIRNRVNVTGVQAGCGGTCPSWPRVTRSDCRWRALCRRSGMGRGRATCRARGQLFRIARSSLRNDYRIARKGWSVTLVGCSVRRSAKWNSGVLSFCPIRRSFEYRACPAPRLTPEKKAALRGIA